MSDQLRLTLRPLAESDEAFYVALYSDELTMRFVAAPLSPSAALASFRAAIRRRCRHIAALEGQPRVLLSADRRGAWLEIGLMLLPAHWGHRLATRAFALWLSEPSIASAPLLIRTAEENVAMRKLAERHGFARADSAESLARYVRLPV